MISVIIVSNNHKCHKRQVYEYWAYKKCVEGIMTIFNSTELRAAQVTWTEYNWIKKS